ncbi:MAG: SiaB family protein kinase [Bacteroidota bacterium]|nr:SiaB family protein kinase [Bacteroidota bacterium]
MLYETLAGSRWGFLYSGDFHDEHSARLIMLAEEAAKASPETETPLAKKLAFTLVEAYQNIIRHRAPLTPDLELGTGRSMFMLRSDGRSYEVAAMNPVRQEESEALQLLLERIKKNTDLKQLKEMFLRGLQNDSNSNRGGAGLGLIEMARRSSSGLHHDLRPGPGGELMFTIQLRVGISSMRPSPLDQIHGFQQTMAALDAVLVFKGTFTSGIQNALMRMIATDHSGSKERADSRTRAFLASMEMLAELPEQAGDGMILLGRNGQDHLLLTGVLLDERAADRLARQVEVLQQMDHNARQKVYRDALLGRDPDGAFTSTGLLDLARRSKAPLVLSKFPHQGNSLLLLEALV